MLHTSSTGSRTPLEAIRALEKKQTNAIHSQLDTIEAVPGVDEFQVVVGRQDPTDPFSMDEMVIREATPRPDREAFADSIVHATAEAVGVRPRVEFAAAREIYDPARQPKAVRLVDRR